MSNWAYLLKIGIALTVLPVLTLAVFVGDTLLAFFGIDIVTHLMGLILAAMAIEFTARGLGQLFPGLLA